MKFSLGKPKLLVELMTSTMITVAEGVSFFVGNKKPATGRRRKKGC